MKKTIFLLSLLLAINIISIFYSLYIKWWWFDIVCHLSGGFLVAMLFSQYLKEHLIQGNKIQTVLIIVGTTVFIGVIWEFMEYIANRTLIDFFYQKFSIRTYFMGDLNDTVKDLLDDTLGALGFSTLHLIRSRDPHQF